MRLFIIHISSLFLFYFSISLTQRTLEEKKRLGKTVGYMPSMQSSLVVNYDCPPGRLYRTRLSSVSPSWVRSTAQSSRRKSVVTLFVPGLDGDDKAADIADALKEGGDSVPRELAEVVRRGTRRGSGDSGGRRGGTGRRDVLGLPFANVHGGARPPQSQDGEDHMASPRPSPAAARAPAGPVDAAACSPPFVDPGPAPVRKVRHAEVVLADQCLVAYGRTWLRLRWPGEQVYGEKGQTCNFSFIHSTDFFVCEFRLPILPRFSSK